MNEQTLSLVLKLAGYKELEPLISEIQSYMCKTGLISFPHQLSELFLYPLKL